MWIRARGWGGELSELSVQSTVDGAEGVDGIYVTLRRNDDVDHVRHTDRPVRDAVSAQLRDPLFRRHRHHVLYLVSGKSVPARLDVQPVLKRDTSKCSMI